MANISVNDGLANYKDILFDINDWIVDTTRKLKYDRPVKQDIVHRSHPMTIFIKREADICGSILYDIHVIDRSGDCPNVYDVLVCKPIHVGSKNMDISKYIASENVFTLHLPNDMSAEDINERFEPTEYHTNIIQAKIRDLSWCENKSELV